MTQTPKHTDFNFDYLLHPATAFRTPMAVVNDPALTTYEKRAILASWASDACAVDDAPGIRKPADAPPVQFDDIMDALKQLDGEPLTRPKYEKLMDRAERWKDFYRRRRDGRPLPG